MLRANYHTHCTFCDGHDTAEEMLQAAIGRGFTHLGFSSHVDPDVPCDWEAYAAEVRRLRAAYAGRIDILLGAELDSLWGPEREVRCPGAEYVIGSTHFLPVDEPPAGCIDWSPERLTELCGAYFHGDWYALVRAYYDFEARVFERTRCDFVGHFDLISGFNPVLHAFDESDPRYLGPALDAMEHLVAQGVPFEINCGSVNRGRKREPFPCRALLQALHDFGGEILINSDAHDAHLIDGGFSLAVELAKQCGFTHTNILAHDTDGAVELRQLALDTL